MEARIQQLQQSLVMLLRCVLARLQGVARHLVSRCPQPESEEQQGQRAACNKTTGLGLTCLVVTPSRVETSNTPRGMVSAGPSSHPSSYPSLEHYLLPAAPADASCSLLQQSIIGVLMGGTQMRIGNFFSYDGYHYCARRPQKAPLPPLPSPLHVVRARYGLMGASTEIAAVDFRFAGAEDTAEILTLVSESRKCSNRLGKKGKRRVRCEGGSRSFI